MVDFLQRNWIGILFVVAMLAMHFGGHRHGDRGGHAGHGGMMRGGCGGQTSTRSHEHASEAGRTSPDSTPPRSSAPDPTRDAYSPDANEADSQVPPDATQPVPGGSSTRSRHRHGC